MTVKYASAMKAQDSSVKIFGPVSWGYCGYFFSPKDNTCGPSGKPINRSKDIFNINFSTSRNDHISLNYSRQSLLFTVSKGLNSLYLHYTTDIEQEVTTQVME